MAVIFCLAFMLLMACKRENKDEPKAEYNIYYVNHEKTAVLSYAYQTSSVEASVVLEELLSQLAAVPEKLEYNAPLAAGFSLIDYNLIDGQLSLNFDSNYKKQEIITEILVRAAIVRTVTQVKEVQQVSFLVEGEPLADASGNVIGMMTQDLFVDNAGNEINTYEKVKMKIYFANEEGDGLTAISRNVVYNSNFSVERQIVEEIIAGPKENDSGLETGNKACPVVNPATKVVSVNIRDGICYVNLDSGFMNQIYNVAPEVTIYAITNSLVELGSVNKVQISVNGETNINYRENISLSTVFERNLDLVK